MHTQTHTDTDTHTQTHAHTRVNRTPTDFILNFVLTTQGDEIETFMQTDSVRWKQTLDNRARKI